MFIGKSFIRTTSFLAVLSVSPTGILAQDDIFEAPKTIFTQEPGTVVVVDIDHDHDNDLVITDRNGNKFTIFFNDGIGNYPTNTVYNSMGNVTALPAVGDFNGDGRLDIAVPHARSSTLEIFHQDSSGNYHHVGSESFGIFHVEAFAADFDNDGYDDVAVLAELSHNLAIFNGSSSGLSFKTSFNVGDACYGMTVADFNRDNFIDIAVVQHYQENAVAHFNSGDFDFLTRVEQYRVGVRPVGITAGDFKENTYTDLVVANRENDNVTILAYNGNANVFEDLGDIFAGDGALFVTTADINQDEHLDIVSANINSEDISILLGDGTGNFDFWDSIVTGPMSRITSGDLNGDLIPDLIVPLGSLNKVLIFIAIQQCTYGPPEQPLTFNRTNGKPAIETFEWDSCGGPGIAIVESSRISSAELQLNGELIIAPELLNQDVHTLMVPVELIAGKNELMVELRGKPGGRISIEFAAVDTGAGLVSIQVFDNGPFTEDPSGIKNTDDYFDVFIDGHFLGNGISNTFQVYLEKDTDHEITLTLTRSDANLPWGSYIGEAAVFLDPKYKIHEALSNDGHTTVFFSYVSESKKIHFTTSDSTIGN